MTTPQHQPQTPKTPRLSQLKNRAGFTLIELLIVAALFSITALIASSVFIDVQSSQRSTQIQQRTASDGRTILETMARSVRTGMVYYGSGDITNPSTSLTTVDQTGTTTCYRWSSNQVQVRTSTTTTDCSDVSWISFTPSILSIDKLQFSFTPRSDPFRPAPRSSSDCKFGATFDVSSGTCQCPTGVSTCFQDQTCAGTPAICINPNIQPQVTISMTTTSITTNPADQVTSNLQTTVVSRVYQR